MHGARGVLESVVQAYPETNVDIHVVWVPMLGSDNESAAGEISGMFDDPRVHQYWDSERLSGTSYAAHVFPTYLTDMHKGLDATLPADHWWREMKHDWKAVKPENAPLWDVAFVYGAGTKWDEHPPTPRDTVKQVFFYGPQSGGKSGMFFAGFKNPPLDTDWAVELAKAMTRLTGRKAKAPPKRDTAISSAPADSAGCQGRAVAIRRQGDKQAEESREAGNRVSANRNSQGDSTKSVELTSLADSLEPLRAHFNANKKKHRFVALLSPT